MKQAPMESVSTLCLHGSPWARPEDHPIVDHSCSSELAFSAEMIILCNWLCSGDKDEFVLQGKCVPLYLRNFSFPSLEHHKVQFLCSLFPAGAVNLVTLSTEGSDLVAGEMMGLWKGLLCIYVSHTWSLWLFLDMGKLLAKSICSVLYFCC